MKPDLAVMLVLISLKRICLRVKHNFGVLNLELNRLEQTPNFTALLVFESHLPHAFLSGPPDHLVILTDQLVLHDTHRVGPHLLGQLDRGVRGVDKCNFGFLAVRHVLSVVIEIIDEYAPLFASEI